MAKAVQCDRCGRFMATTSAPKLQAQSPVTKARQTYEVCEHCIELFWLWWHSESPQRPQD